MTRDTVNDQYTSNQLGPDALDILADLERNWREMCGNALRPTHAGLNPQKMERSLPYTFILKRHAPGQAQLRVAGQKMHEFFNVSLADMNFADLFEPKCRDTATELMETAFTLPAIVSFSLVAKRSFGRRPVRAQINLLPMRDPKGDISRVLGAVVTDGTACPHPLRFEIDHTQPIRCDIQDGQFPDRRVHQRIATNSNRDHLKLVVNNG